MTPARARCGKRYGSRRQRRCKRYAGHQGGHGPRLRPEELARVIRPPRSKRTR